ncbi:cysteine protease ATG4B-like [Uloborus diversus]|uniref:cysteine protease ATG4B-like n=1 Tax=Uloborus diversus TaxID=327109 RepID=UPI002409060B|nr:cysteine protease ATG4B-like [Uloborus diversus]
MELYNFFAGINGKADLPKNELKDFSFTLNDLWLLGKRYNVVHDIEDIRKLIRSKIWFSYRSGFPAIGGTGPKTDKNWGCMLRCGQMIMAEALICRHLGRGWIWEPGVVDPVYAAILKMFQDRKDCPYSIHQIAQMGASEGKVVGQWFGPNTVAQVLRKLSVFDEWSSLAVHVAFDNSVIKSDIKTLCKYVPEPLTSSPFPKQYQTVWYTDCVEGKCPRYQSITSGSCDLNSWRPMLLFIPLRLGLQALNPLYCESLKNTFCMKQSLGIIGGRPRHAVWFIGYSGDELICLDPHVVQATVDLDHKAFDDSSYHIPYAGSKRMLMADIDPSLALCFFFESEEDFEDWCKFSQRILGTAEKQHLYEIMDERPEHWPPLELRPDINCSSCCLEYFFVDENTGEVSEEDFEKVDAVSCTMNKSRPNS